MNSRTGLPLLVSLWLIASSLLTANVRAQAEVQTPAPPAPPAMTVASFDGAVSPADADAMADELAMRMVETGRFRVLERQWLPLPGNVAHPSLATMREAAAGAGVQFIVFGAVRMVSGGRSSISVSVRVVDVASGDVIRTSVASAPMASRPLPRPILQPGLGMRGPVGAIATLLTARASVRSAGHTGINPAAQHAIADIAHTLNMPRPAREQ